ncbi:protein PXR1-like [Benincasa hispida]|uniref:protein PXR1-like n=1 Tax=Benincasa hispida TaxID=102211 RepID=UPI001901FD29|nr:protein PXR1-like [Benincasa hispida]
MEEKSRRSALTILDPKEAANAESYEGPIRVALEEVAAEKQFERAEKKKKSKENRAEEDEQAHQSKAEKKIKEKEDEEDEEAKLKKMKERSERKETRREKRCLKKEEERRKRAESPELDRESTSVREDKGESAQHKTPQTIATDEGEDVEITLLTRRRKENAPQRSTIDPLILIDALEE